MLTVSVIHALRQEKRRQRLVINRRVRLILALILSALLLYLAFNFLSWNSLLSSWRQFDQRWLMPVIGLVLLLYALRALRWQRILNPVSRVPLPLLFEATILSAFTNLILPINVGELVRAYLIKKKYQVSMFTLVGTFAMERVGGIVAFAVVGGIALLLVTLPPELAQIQRQVSFSLVTVLVILLVLLLLTVLAQQRSSVFTQVGHWLTNRLSPQWQARLVGGWQRFRQGLQFGGTHRETALILLYSVAMRVTSGLIMLCLAQGFGIALPLAIFLFLDVLVTFAHMVGSHLFGIVGASEVSLTYGLRFFAVAKETGLSIALLMTASSIAPVVVLGPLFFLKQGLTWQELRDLPKHASWTPSIEDSQRREIVQNSER